jgi:hypothetical protein
VGDFTALLLDINSTLSVTGYPSIWTQYTVSVSGLAGPTTGRFALRYFVPNGGPNGANSDFLGVDTVTITTPMNSVPVTGTLPLVAAALAGLLLMRRQRAA